ncbi:MAG TPA: carbon-nitrogen hydrolase family protein, partial [Tianweitania sediminis]|nr:carbon-nitrogen hydrolase family protein [Tianweitania sediminis]
MIKLAACQYAIELIETWEDYARHLAQLVEDAAGQGAELLLLPEYAGLVLAGQLEPAIRSDLHGSIAGIQPLIPRWLELCESLARQHGVVLQPGSAPVLDHDGQYRNRVWLFGPDGRIGHQDKQIMTRFEREQWGIAAGEDGLKAFDTHLGRLGILICYDNEFPMLGRRLADLGVDLVLAPSCTDTLAGSYRVRIGAQARALENQYAVLASPTAGTAPWSPAMDENR